MKNNLHSITGRVLVGESIGFVIGMLALLFLPLITSETTLEFRLGFLLLMMLMGAMIGLAGVYTRHPILPLNLPWWIRGSSIGSGFFLTLVLLAGDQLDPILASDVVAWTGLTSPYWAIIDGIILGGFIGYFATRICGEGELPVS